MSTSLKRLYVRYAAETLLIVTRYTMSGPTLSHCIRKAPVRNISTNFNMALVVELNRVDLVEDRDLKCYHTNIGQSGALGLGRHRRSVC